MAVNIQGEVFRVVMLCSVTQHYLVSQPRRPWLGNWCLQSFEIFKPI